MTPAELKQARKTLGLTPQQMADMLGYGAKTRISEIENGKANPSAAVIRLLHAYVAGYRPSDWPHLAQSS